MNDSAREDMPRTAGELRRRLAELGDPWTVDPRLGDDDPLPTYARGGQPDDEIPEDARPPTIESEDELRRVLLEEPPANPFLEERWAELGLRARNNHDTDRS